MTHTILVTGATGNIGRHVVTGLLVRGATRAGTDPAGVAAADFPPQVQVSTGDLTEPGSLDEALDGVDAVFLLWSPGVSLAGAHALAVAVAAHARHVVYVSAMSSPTR